MGSGQYDYHGFTIIVQPQSLLWTTSVVHDTSILLKKVEQNLVILNIAHIVALQ